MHIYKHTHTSICIYLLRGQPVLFITGSISLALRNECTGTIYARRMGQPTQRATNYTAQPNIDTAQNFLHANGQRPKRAMIRQRSRRRQRRGEPHTEHGLGVLAQHISHSHSGIDEKSPTEKFVGTPAHAAQAHSRPFPAVFTFSARCTAITTGLSTHLPIYLPICLYDRVLSFFCSAPCDATTMA